MDITKFTPNKTGDIVEVSGIPGVTHSFIPAPLPPNWQWDQNLWTLLLEARTALARLDGVGRYLPSTNLLLQPLKNREAIRSSSLEGTYATPEQLLLFQIDPDYEENNEKNSVNEFREVNNYSQALNYYFQGKTQLPLSLRLLRELHQILLSNVRGGSKQPGKFRNVQNQIGMPARYVPPSPNYMIESLSNLEKYLHAALDFDPLVKSFLVHYQFEAIHPFLDGNGRVGRLLLAITIKEWCELSEPWLYMSAYFDANRDEYIERLFRVSSNGEWKEWVEFCLKGVVFQARDTEQRCNKLLGLSENFKKRILKINGNSRQQQIANDLFVTPFIQIPYTAERFGVTYPTAEADINKLIKAGILKRASYTKKKTYFSPEIIEIAYE